MDLPSSIMFSTTLIANHNVSIVAGGVRLSGLYKDEVFVLVDDGIAPINSNPLGLGSTDPSSSNGTSVLSNGELVAAIVVLVGVTVIASVLLAVLLTLRKKKKNQ